MRDQTRQLTEPGTPAPTAEIERERWRVQRFPDGRVRVTVERGTVVVSHTGTPAAVRARLAVDAPAYAQRIDVDITDVVEGRVTTPVVAGGR